MRNPAAVAQVAVRDWLKAQRDLPADRILHGLVEQRELRALLEKAVFHPDTFMEERT